MPSAGLPNSNKPWYSYPMVWMLIAIPFAAVIMGVIMIWMALDTDDGLVVDDYYKQGLEINRVIARDKNAAELGLSAVVEFDNITKVIRMEFNKGQLDAFPDSMLLKLRHATRANSDISVQLDHGIDNLYIGRVGSPVTEGVWYFSLAGTNAAGEGWKLDAKTHLQSHSIVHLQSDYEKAVNN